MMLMVTEPLVFEKSEVEPRENTPQHEGLDKDSRYGAE